MVWRASTSRSGRRASSAVGASLLRDEELRLYVALPARRRLARGSPDALPGDRYDLDDSIRHAAVPGDVADDDDRLRLVDFALWPQLALFLLVIAVMFIGGCTGSTGGAIKVIRVLDRGARDTPGAALDAASAARAADPQLAQGGARAGRARRRSCSRCCTCSVFALGVLVLLIDAEHSRPRDRRLRRRRGRRIDDRQRRARQSGCRPDGLVRSFRRRLHGRDDDPHVGRPARAHAGARLAEQLVLAAMTEPEVERTP